MMSEFIPNTFQTPNAIIDRLMFLLTDSEFRVLMYTVRHILGWQKKASSRRAHISLSVYENGFSYDTPDGEMSYPGCGLGRGTIRKALKSLQTYRILKAVGKPSQRGQQWELAFMTDDDVDIAGLKLRQETKSRKAKKQTAKARKASPNNHKGVLLNSHTSGGTVEQSQGGTVEQSQGGTVEQSPTKDHSKDHSKDQSTLRDTAQTISEVKAGPHNKTVITSDFVMGVDWSQAPAVEKPTLDKASRDRWYEAVNAVWGFEAGRNVNMQKFLRGEHTGKGKYAQYQLPVGQLTPDKVRRWAAHYRKEELSNDPDMNMVSDLEKVQSSIVAWLKQDTKPNVKTIMTVDTSERGFITDSASEGVVRYEKRKPA